MTRSAVSCALLSAMVAGCILPVGAAAAQSGPATYAVPIQVDGVQHLSGATWAILFVNPGGSLEGTLDLQGAAEGTNSTWALASLTLPSGQGIDPFSLTHGELPVRMEDGQVVVALGRRGPGHLLVEAEGMEVTWNAKGRIETHEDGDGMGRFVSPSPYPYYWDGPVGGNTVVESVRPKEGQALEVHAQGVHRIAWAGASLECSAKDCPQGGGFWNLSTVPAAGARTSAQGYAIESFSVPGATLHLAGQAREGLFAGKSLSLGLDGWMRLPAAQGHPGGQTFWAAGNLTFADLRYAKAGSIHSTLVGELRASRLDEEILGELPWEASSVAVGGIAVGLGLARPAWAALVSRRIHDPLSHPRRRALFAAIQGDPGLTFRALQRLTGLATGTARHHLTVLSRSGLVVERRHRSTLRFFESQGTLDPAWHHEILLREPGLRVMHGWLRSRGEVPQRDVLDAMERQGWRRSTTQHRLERLVVNGLARVRWRGRYKMYAAVVAAPSALPVAAGADGVAGGEEAVAAAARAGQDSVPSAAPVRWAQDALGAAQGATGQHGVLGPAASTHAASLLGHPP